MKVVVLCDELGKIISIGRLGEVGDEPSGTELDDVSPQPGQQAHYIDLPAELEKIQLLALHNQFCLDLKSERPQLVRVRNSAEPSTKK